MPAPERQTTEGDRLSHHPKKRPGHLKIYLGYAAGVGKTYRMLEEAQSLHAQGVDVVIGYFEPHGRAETIAKTEGLELIPRRPIDYAGTKFEEMDTEAILRRKPALAVVDEFAHSNVPGSKNAKRWQDVHELLDAGINVLTTMNVQHLESLNDQVWHFTGVRVRETIPDWVVDEADEVVLVDLTPRALRNRIERGVVYSAGKSPPRPRQLLRRSQPHRAARTRHPPHRPRSGRETHRAAPRRTHPDLPDRQPDVSQPDPPRQAYGGLPASRLASRSTFRPLRSSMKPSSGT